jgi:hypothetical protein
LSAPRISESSSVKALKSKPSTTASLVGTCTDLEKPYFRLTTFPKSENVRPLQVLVRTLAHIKSRFIQTEDFEWANEQLKSARQDITVQRIRTKFVLEVYETHARILLEHGDLPEFHQCQSMLLNLTTGSSGYDQDEHIESKNDGIHEGELLEEENNSTTTTSLRQAEESADEFRAYGLLYALVQNSWGDLTRALTYAETHRGDSSPDGERPAILRGSSFRHAVRVVKAVIHNDYQAFFRLYESAPHLSAYLLDFLVRRVRAGAYERIIAAYRPAISVEHFRGALFFKDLEETRRFLRKSKAVFMQEQRGPPFWVDCKATSASSSASSSS